MTEDEGPIDAADAPAAIRTAAEKLEPALRAPGTRRNGAQQGSNPYASSGTR
jgi:hypothetical protein